MTTEKTTTTTTTTTTKTKSKNPVPNRERIKMPRQHMPEQLPVLRAQQFTEVNLGYSEELARQEAIRAPISAASRRETTGGRAGSPPIA